MTTVTCERPDDEKQYVRHIVKNGSRDHVIQYLMISGKVYMRCSERNCEINKDYDEEVRE